MYIHITIHRDVMLNLRVVTDLTISLINIHTQTLNAHTYNNTQGCYAESEGGNRFDHQFRHRNARVRAAGMYIHICAYSRCVYACLCANYFHPLLHVCMQISMYVCIHVCMHTCMYACA
jgi:hypothetical protein